ncbi:MAG: 3-deoxy-manno-octulosonate cytidylyltransferase [Myxococcota bacterium]|jgi:3-deoxy-manno-octulosonate cytidylyltransferase (CMP-KDO synthetase)|nr:3-deoxy-manno-octulosonate cytidylyltransferase [Myxococcota bacterium]
MAIAIIPARLASTRFPEKVLACDTGRPLVQHVVDRVRSAQRIEHVVVATDDRRIEAALEPFGTEVVMTSAAHPNGTSRIREAIDVLGTGDRSIARAPETIVVNVQGDEPEIDPAAIDVLVETLAAGDPARTPMATLASPFAEEDDPGDPNLVKVVLRADGSALYFSRALIPHTRRDGPTHPVGDEVAGVPLKHIGAYAYRAHFLSTYADLAPTPLELAERLEQLRAVEHGYPIAVARVSSAHHGIDTREQYRDFVRRHQQRTGRTAQDEAVVPATRPAQGS